MRISEKQSDIFSILKGFLPLLVVVLHTSFDASLCYRDGVEAFIRVLITKIGGVAVPSFFFISGILFFTKLQEWDWETWENKALKRIKTLLLPYVLWILIAFVLKFVRSILKHELPKLSITSLQCFFTSNGALRMFFDRPLEEWSISILGYAVDASKPIDAPLWYIRELIVLVLLSPLIWKAIKVSSSYVLAVFGILYLLNVGLPFVLISPTALFFFGAGAAFTIDGKDFLNAFHRYKVLSFAASAIFLFLSFLITDSLWNGLVFRCFVLSNVVMIFNIVSDMYDAGRIRPNQLLTDSSFFIYAGHAVLITEISNFLLWRALPITTEWMALLKVFLRPAIAVGICLLIFSIMRKTCPKTLSVLTGGRG